MLVKWKHHPGWCGETNSVDTATTKLPHPTPGTLAKRAAIIIASGMRTGILLICLAVGEAAAQDSAAVVERGKYLAESVGACHTCHTPKLETGELDKSKWMKGAVLDIAPLKTIPKWHKTSPDLTPSGTLFKKWGPAGIVKFLVTGKNPKGNPADPPMPTYQFSHEDAVAVVEYLKTLN